MRPSVYADEESIGPQPEVDDDVLSGRASRDAGDGSKSKGTARLSAHRSVGSVEEARLPSNIQPPAIDLKEPRGQARRWSILENNPNPKWIVELPSDRKVPFHYALLHFVAFLTFTLGPLVVVIALYEFPNPCDGLLKNAFYWAGWVPACVFMCIGTFQELQLKTIGIAYPLWVKTAVLSVAAVVVVSVYILLGNVWRVPVPIGTALAIPPALMSVYIIHRILGRHLRKADSVVAKRWIWGEAMAMCCANPFFVGLAFFNFFVWFQGDLQVAVQAAFIVMSWGVMASAEFVAGKTGDSMFVMTAFGFMFNAMNLFYMSLVSPNISTVDVFTINTSVDLGLAAWSVIELFEVFFRTQEKIVGSALSMAGFKQTPPSKEFEERLQEHREYCCRKMFNLVYCSLLAPVAFILIFAAVIGGPNREAFATLKSGLISDEQIRLAYIYSAVRVGLSILTGLALSIIVKRAFSIDFISHGFKTIQDNFWVFLVLLCFSIYCPIKYSLVHSDALLVDPVVCS